MRIRNALLGPLYRSKFLQAAFFNPLVEFHQWRLNKFVRSAAATLSPDQVIFDIGAGELKYRTYFAHCRYVSSDLCIGDGDWNYKGIDVVASAYQLPLPADSLDAVLCIQVLEHLEAPIDALLEFRRVLKPFGRAYVSAPLLAGEHQQPFDFFRYTRYGLATLAARSGFKVVSLEPHGGSVIALELQLWSTFWGLLPFRRQGATRYILYLALYPIKLLTGALALAFDAFDRTKSATINYDVVLEKESSV
jgi:SAM-dependent methyltransferase